MAVKRIVPQRPRPAPPGDDPDSGGREDAPGLAAVKHSGIRCHWAPVRANPRRIGIHSTQIRPVFEGRIRPGVFFRAAGGGAIAGPAYFDANLAHPDRLLAQILITSARKVYRLATS